MSTSAIIMMLVALIVIWDRHLGRIHRLRPALA